MESHICTGLLIAAAILALEMGLLMSHKVVHLYVEYIMSVTDSEPILCPSITVEELDEILDRIAATSAFSSPDLRNRTKEKHVELLLINDMLLRDSE